MRLVCKCLIVIVLLLVAGLNAGSRSVSAQQAAEGMGCQKSLDGLGDLDGANVGRGSMDANSLTCVGTGGDCGGPLVI